jgi:transposase, IS30 family
MRDPRKFTGDERAEIWDRIRAGESIPTIAESFGRYPSAVRKLLMATGGVRPRERHRSERNLSLDEREEISRGLATGSSLRSIAARLGRAPSTVSKEVLRNGGVGAYRACPADRRADRQARRPKTPKLARCPKLRRQVEAKLELEWSPVQISRWLAIEHAHDPEMRVSHETIYLSLYVQGRGALRKELHQALRTGRAMRRPKRRLPTGRGVIPNMVMISERPAEVEDRAVPGHWEGDLILGSRKTCIGTLVERSTRYVMLLMKLEKEHGRAGPPGHEQEDPVIAHRAAAQHHLGPGQGDGRAPQVHCLDWRADLLLRSEQPLAARHQREHQRPVASVLPQGHQPVGSHPGRAQRCGQATQRAASTDP